MNKTRFVVQSAVIAAMYATLTILQSFLFPGSTSMAVQFRISEVLTILALYTPAAIPGLTIGCVVANISSVSTLGAYDMIFGSIASLLAAAAMHALRNVRLWKLPIAACFMPALMNGIIVGLEIEFFFVRAGFGDFIIQGGLVALGELAVLFVLGLPLSRLIEHTGLDNKLLSPVSKK